MLRGIRDDLKLRAGEEGYRVVDYLPYGEEWYPYSVRRIKEHPSNIWLLLRSISRQQERLCSRPILIRRDKPGISSKH